MDLDANAILASIVISGIGTVALVYGKRQARFPHMIAGVLLIAYPFFISNLFLMAGIAIVILAALWGAVRFGW